MAGLKFYNNAQTFSTTLNVPEPIADTTKTIATLESPALVTPTVDGENFSAFSGLKNYIINGNFDVWQYGTSQTSNGYGSDDRWINANSGTTKIHSQVACTDTERVLFNASKFSRTVVTSVAGAAYYCAKFQAIEDITKLAGKTVTVSFWAKADVSKNIAIELTQWFGTGGTPSAGINGIGSQLIALTSTWQKYSIAITIPSIVGKTLGTDGVHTSYTGFEFWFDSGSNYDTRTASLGQQSGAFDIAQIQIEEGSVATPFDNRPYGLELSLCQRYYQQLLKGMATGYVAHCGNTTSASFAITLPVVMRVPPTGVTGGGDIIRFYSAGAYKTVSSWTVAGTSTKEICVILTLSTTVTAGVSGYTVSAADGLQNITLSAEL